MIITQANKLVPAGSLKADPSITEFAPKTFPEAVQLLGRFWWTCCGVKGSEGEEMACKRGPHRVFGELAEGQEEEEEEEMVVYL